MGDLAMKQLLFFIQSEKIYDRIVSEMDTRYLSGHINDVATLRSWLSKNEPAAALVDKTADDGVLQLLERFNINVDLFDGNFTNAEIWIRNHLSMCDDESDHLPEQTSKSVAALPQRKRQSSTERMQALIPNVQTESEPVIKIVEKEVIREVVIPKIVTQALRSRIIVVVSLWPRAGATFISTVIAHLLSQSVATSESVTLIEHPANRPGLFHLLDFKSETDRYKDWLIDGKGTPFVYQDILFVPRPQQPNIHVEDANLQDKLIQFVYRKMNLPFVVIDAGMHYDDEMLLDLADDVILVLDCDPQYLADNGYIERYLQLSEHDKTTTVLNKWTRQAQVLKDMPGSMPVPYLPTDRMQFAAWEGVLPTALPDIREHLEVIDKKLIQPWIPKTLRTEPVSRNWPWKRRKQL